MDTAVLLAEWGTSTVKRFLAQSRVFHHREYHQLPGEEHAVFTFPRCRSLLISKSRIADGFNRPVLKARFNLELTDLRVSISQSTVDAYKVHHRMYLVNKILTIQDPKAGPLEFCRVHSVIIPEAGLFQMHLKLTKRK